MMSFSITSAKFEEYRAVLVSQYNIHLDEDSGKIRYKGCVVEYIYHHDTSTLDVTVLLAPIIFPKSRVEQEIKKWFNGSREVTKQ